MPSRAVRSEAAIKRVIKNWGKLVTYEDPINPVLQFVDVDNDDVLLIAELDLRDFIKKRKPLTGIKKQVDKIVRGSNAKQSRKKAQKGHK